MDMLNNLSNAATNLNNIGTNIHYYNAFTSADPNQKKIANDRIFCTNKFIWHKIKSIFYIIILPFLLIFVIAFLSNIISINPGIYIILFLWIIFGSIYAAYLQSIRWNFIQYKINTYGNINQNNCGF